MDIFGLEKLSLVDYDGKVSATLFTATCNFRCGFCHNSALVLDTNALTPMSQDEIFSYLTKRFGILDGVCVSGGEPTLQKDLPEFIEKIKKIGYSVKLDSNGTNPDMIKLLKENGLVDYFAIDIKNCREKYPEIIGIKGFNTEKVEKTVDYLITNCTDYEFRTTLINEYHGIEEMKKIAEWIKGASKYCLQQFKESENCIDATSLSKVSEEKAKEFLEIVSPFVKKAILRGY
ncbi:MAG: anaerobic ribonucleoside-triphosphate reductase activating protein [Clostridia bacterium]|nr:anaerobic ribonucleoside-triphosphate reductase activating protein [Clostridia bacterium]